MRERFVWSRELDTEYGLFEEGRLMLRLIDESEEFVSYKSLTTNMHLATNVKYVSRDEKDMVSRIDAKVLMKELPMTLMG